MCNHYDVFISARLENPDRQLAKRLYEYLSSKGVATFFCDISLRNSGETFFFNAIEEALESAQILIAVAIEPATLHTEWIKHEWHSFLAAIHLGKKPKGKMIVYLGACEPDHHKAKLQSLPMGLLGNQAFFDSLEALETLYNYISNALHSCSSHHVIAKPSTPSQIASLSSLHQAISKGTSPVLSRSSAAPELRYPNLFEIGPLKVPYSVILGGWDPHVHEYPIGQVHCILDTHTPYSLPSDFERFRIPNFISDCSKCRLVGFDFKHMPGSMLSELHFAFSKTEYLEYLMSGEHLDDLLPSNPSQTYRDLFAPDLYLSHPEQSRLTRICGVGIFILTADDQIIISKHSSKVRVYGNHWGFSASGTMDWNDQDVNVFKEVARECYEETKHRIQYENTYLYGFGIDTKKLYYQFCFYEKSPISSRDILSQARLARDYYAEMAELISIPYQLESLIDYIRNYPWEPAAAASLLLICTKKFGVTAVEKALDQEFARKKIHEEMYREWEERSSRPGVLSVMSLRYPNNVCEEESNRYVEAVIHFLEGDIEGRNVIEIGGGIGRLTEKIAPKVKRLTCVDLSSGMLALNRQRIQRLGNPILEKVVYWQGFAQEYPENQFHDLAICSLVLGHNVDEDDYRELIEVLRGCAPVVFLFEHVDTKYQSSHTHPRSEEELLRAFSGYRVERRAEHQLIYDNILFLKLSRPRE